jgi:hypothetical protein
VEVIRNLSVRSDSASAKWTHSTSSQPISIRSILILSYHLRLGLPRGLFSSGFSTKIIYAPLMTHMRVICSTHHFPWPDHSNKILWSVQIIKLLITQSSPASRHFLPFRSKYFHLDLYTFTTFSTVHCFSWTWTRWTFHSEKLSRCLGYRKCNIKQISAH